MMKIEMEESSDQNDLDASLRAAIAPWLIGLRPWEDLITHYLRRSLIAPRPGN
jgi:hypothetical protein